MELQELIDKYKDKYKIYYYIDRITNSIRVRVEDINNEERSVVDLFKLGDYTKTKEIAEFMMMETIERLIGKLEKGEENG